MWLRFGSGCRLQWSVVLSCMALTWSFATPAVLSAAIAQGYTASEKLRVGTLVSLKSGGVDQVVAANTQTVEGLVGVVVGAKDATLALNAQPNRHQVATSGLADVFVTDLDGAIKEGDKITASPIAGVGMKATQSAKIVGVASGGFDGSRSQQKVDVRTHDGKTRSAAVGSIPVEVQVAYYAVPDTKSVIPAFLQRFANVLAGKPVPVFRVIVATAIVLGAIVIVAIMLFSAIRSSLISIGRNPLAQSNIYKGLLQVLLGAVAILVIATGAAYMVLSR